VGARGFVVKVEACVSGACGTHRRAHCAVRASAMRMKVETYLLPVFLQRRHGGEVAGVVDDLKFLKDTVVR